jgi:hypothetical protein
MTLIAQGCADEMGSPTSFNPYLAEELLFDDHAAVVIESN